MILLRTLREEYSRAYAAYDSTPPNTVYISYYPAPDKGKERQLFILPQNEIGKRYRLAAPRFFWEEKWMLQCDPSEEDSNNPRWIIPTQSQCFQEQEQQNKVAEETTTKLYNLIAFPPSSFSKPFPQL